MTKAETEELIRGLAPGIFRYFKEYLQSELRPLQTKDAALEQRIASVEAVTKEFRYTGTHVPGRTYRAGNSCTLGGSVWIATRDTSQRPEAGSDWQLCVKRGADGRDAR